MPEVVVIWYDDVNDIMLKAMIDYFKPDGLTDLKTFTNTRIRKIDKAVMDAIVEYKYHIQPAHYLEAARRAIEFAKDGAVFYKNDEPTDRDMDFILALAEKTNTDFTFTWVFQKKEGAPIARGYRYPQKSMLEGAAKAAIEDAIRIYKEHQDRFGDGLWIDDSEIVELSEMDFPERLTEF